MIKNGDVIRHKRSMDIAAVVRGLSSSYVTLEWFNMGFVKSWFLEVEDSTLDTRGLSDWEICVTYNPKCYRYAVWRKL